MSDDPTVSFVSWQHLELWKVMFQSTHQSPGLSGQLQDSPFSCTIWCVWLSWSYLQLALFPPFLGCCFSQCSDGVLCICQQDDLLSSRELQCLCNQMKGIGIYTLGYGSCKHAASFLICDDKHWYCAFILVLSRPKIFYLIFNGVIPSYWLQNPS